MKVYLTFFVLLIACIKTSAQHKLLNYPAKDSSVNQWEFSVWCDYLLKPNNGSYFNPILYADNKSFRFEGRFNYEALNTASAFAGWKFNGGNSLKVEVTPMFGVVFGQTKGIAPAIEAQLSYKRIGFYTESEYMIDRSGKENNYLFIYTELGYSFGKPFRAGLSALRTKLYQTEFDVQRGLFGEYFFGKFRTGIYYYDPLTTSNFAEISFSVDF